MDKSPIYSQLSPIYAALLSDYNNDEKIDIIIGGNQFRAKPQIGIYAASHGAVYENRNNEEFRAVRSSESGIFIKEEIRDIKQIHVGNKNHVLISSSNGKLRCYSVSNEN